MAKKDERDYLKKIGEAGLAHAVNKPYSDENCDLYFLQIGTLFSLLPPPPGALLDLGCGTGWTSAFFARRGYEVVGQDLSEDMIRAARATWTGEAFPNLAFVCGDFEELDFRDRFDIAVFFDSLHHAQDEAAAVRSVYRALKPGGVCVTVEPGEGHAASHHAVRARERYGVTEKDMPPRRIRRLGAAAGFSSVRIFADVYTYPRIFVGRVNGNAWLRRLPAGNFFLQLLRVINHQRRRRGNGMVVMIK